MPPSVPRLVVRTNRPAPIASARPDVEELDADTYSITVLRSARNRITMAPTVIFLARPISRCALKAHLVHPPKPAP
jgi:hypothetical protein